MGDCWEYDGVVDIESLSHKIVHLIAKFALPIIDQLVSSTQFHEAVITKLRRMHDALKKGHIMF